MLSAELEGNQVQSSCINADMKADKKKDRYQTQEKSSIRAWTFLYQFDQK